MRPPEKLNHFVELDITESFDPGDAVTNFADGADVASFHRRRYVGDLLFNFLEDAAHG